MPFMFVDAVEDFGICGVCDTPTGSRFCSDLCYRLAYPSVTVYTRGEVWEVPREVWETAAPPVGASEETFLAFLEGVGDFVGSWPLRTPRVHGRV